MPVNVSGQGEILPTPPADVDDGSPDPNINWQLGFNASQTIILGTSDGM